MSPLLKISFLCCSSVALSSCVNAHPNINPSLTYNTDGKNYIFPEFYAKNGIAYLCGWTEAKTRTVKKVIGKQCQATFIKVP